MTFPAAERQNEHVPTIREPAADHWLEIPMALLGRTVKQTRMALGRVPPGEVLAVHTNDP